MDKEKKKITLKNADGKKLLYPKTSASQVEVTSNGTMLDQYLKGMVETVDNSKNLVIVKEAKKVSNILKLKDASGTEKKFDGSAEIDLSTTGVYYAANAGKATNSDNAEVANYLYYDKVDEGKEQKIDSEGLIAAAASKAVADVGTTLLPSYYTKDQIDTKLKGVGKIGAATRGGAGIVRLATQEEVNSGEVTENIPEGGNPDEPPAVVVTPMTLAKKLENYATPTDVANEVAKIVAGADKDFDTLKEIADWILNDTTGAASMANAISANTSEITKIKEGTTTVPKATSATTAGSATTATTATNLSSAPSLGTSGKTITVTAGGKTSSAITVPYATSAGSATSATSATTATNLASAPVLANGTTDSNKIKITAGGKTSSEFTVPYSTKAGSATSATTAEKAAKDSNGNTIDFTKDGVETLLNLTYDGGTEDVTY